MTRRILAILLLSAAAITAAALSASRPSGQLTGSDPPDQAVLAVPPAAVDLVFDAPPRVDSSHVSVQDEQGSSVDSGSLASAGTDRLRRPVSIRTAGGFTVAYHVVFADGTTATGVVRFSVDAGGRPPQAPPSVAAGGHEHGIDPLSAFLLLADAAVVIVVGLLLLRRPRAEHWRR